MTDISSCNHCRRLKSKVNCNLIRMNDLARIRVYDSVAVTLLAEKHLADEVVGVAIIFVAIPALLFREHTVPTYHRFDLTEESASSALDTSQRGRELGRSALVSADSQTPMSFLSSSSCSGVAFERRFFRFGFRAFFCFEITAPRSLNAIP